MKVFINERSFNGEVAAEEEAFEVLSEIVRVADFLQIQANGGPIYRHRELKNCRLTRELSIIEFLRGLTISKDPQKRKVATTFLVMFAKAPFVESCHNDASNVVDTAGSSLKNTCFDAASSCCCGAALISSSINQTYAESYVEVSSSIYGKKRIANYRFSADAQGDTWIYESNPKHEIKDDKTFRGKVHTAMTLADIEAQKALTNGIMVGKVVYSAYQGRWYKFHCHHNNNFHGFPIDCNRLNDKEFKFAEAYHDRHGENLSGQINEYCCCTISRCNTR